MRRPTAVALLLLLMLAGGCSSPSGAKPPRGVADASLAPAPVATLPAQIAALPASAHYLAKARKELSRADLASALSALAKLQGVNGASLTRTTVRVDVSPDITTAQRVAVLRQLAAIGSVSTA
ncbi:MAG: hypothetical protein JWM02_2301 [Frankiales bacterium]|nr:hypothetical protein [Frankiales bacterium]